MASKNKETNMDSVDQKVFAMAAMLDTTIRFHKMNWDPDQMEQDYLGIWLKKERDPLLVSIIATLTGDRDIANQPEGENNGTGQVADAA